MNIRNSIADLLIIVMGTYIGLGLFAITLKKIIEARIKESSAQGGVDTISNVAKLLSAISGL